MEWIVKIEGNDIDFQTERKLPISNQRIKIKYYPQNDEIVFIGQYKTKKSDWVDFCEESYTTEIDLEKIQELLYKTYFKLNERVNTYENLAEGFDEIKLIQIVDEESELNSNISTDIH